MRIQVICNLKFLKYVLNGLPFLRVRAEKLNVSPAFRGAVKGVDNSKLIFQISEFFLRHIFLEKCIKRYNVRRKVIRAKLRSLFQIKLAELKRNGQISEG